MKAKKIVPENSEQLKTLPAPILKAALHRAIQQGGKALKVALAPPADKEDLDIDLHEFHALFKVNDVLEKLYRTSTPGATDCEDESCFAHKQASALLSYVEYAELGLMAEGSELVNPAAGAIVDAIHLQLDIMRLAGKRLYSLCRAHDSHRS